MSWQNTRTTTSGQPQRVRTRTTRRFTTHLHQLYLALTASIEGIEDTSTCSRYASLLLHRLLFIYFLQHLDLPAGGRDYLQDNLRAQRVHGSSFYRGVIRPLFGAEGQSTRFPLSLAGLFSSHAIEQEYPAVEISDDFFTRLFALFAEYRWQLDEHVHGAEGVITPEILGILFDQRRHTKEMGAYYTPREVTAYIARNSVLPALFTRAQALCTTGAALDTLLWHTLLREPLRYIYPAMRKGYEMALPSEIAAGLEDSTRRAFWQQRAPATHALPGETWREVIARHTGVDEILAGIQQDAPVTLARLVTWNLDLFALTLETLRTCQQPEILLAYYQSLRQLSVLDPTCGSGAFLCAALPLLQDLYAACLTRMEELCTTPDISSTDRRALQTHLEEAGPPPLRAASSLRWIIGHNLYGVDLNAEAVEVCRLRLYLKLCHAQPDDQPAPLPDDFGLHIRVGNSLLGSLSNSASAQTAQTSPESLHYRQILDWQQAFPTPMAHGGFDVVIGNPPYVEYERVRPLYTLDGYATLRTGNLYALTMERATHLLASGGRFGMIVPSSATCTDGYHSLQQLLLAQQELHIASFSDQRGHLFALSHPRLCIILYTRASHIPALVQQSSVFSTPYIKLGEETRASLFEHLTYTEVTPHVRPGLIPRYGSPLELAIANKLASQHQPLGASLQHNGQHAIYFTRKLSWYVQITPFIPRILDAYGQPRIPSELKHLRFSTFLHARVAFAALNSNLFYWLITTGSDCRNLNMREVQGLPLNLAGIAPALQVELCHLSDELERDLLRHARMKPMVFRDKDCLTIQCLYPAHSKPLIDQIDRVLARHYAFDEQELDFLLHYDEKYRRAQPFADKPDGLTIGSPERLALQGGR